MQFDDVLLRKQMVECQIKGRGISDARLLESFLAIPRHLFIPEQFKLRSYEDTSLPIGEGQTISQPFIVALMADAAQLKPEYRVLEIGTGSGYAAAVLSLIVSEVYTVERLFRLADQAQERFRNLHYFNIHVKSGDGTVGWPEEAPFDAILVAAGAPVVPKMLLQQLKVGGRMVVPVGGAFIQDLNCYQRKSETSYSCHTLQNVRFVPLIGQEGWHEQGN